jgi:twitching motility protein PilT
MEKLNQFLQQLISQRGEELHLEPNKQPYVVTDEGKNQISNIPLPGAQINTMIFALIPTDVKQQLPDNSSVEFIHPHNLGDFNFFVRKSSAGFNVTITPTAANPVAHHNLPFKQEDDGTTSSEILKASPIPDEIELSATPFDNSETDLVVEINSPPPVKNEFLKENSMVDDVLSTSDYVVENLGKDSVIQESLPTNLSDQTLNSNQYQQVDLEPVLTSSNDFPQEQTMKTNENKIPANDYPSKSSITSPPPNSYTQQSSQSVDDESVFKAFTPTVENVQFENNSLPQVEVSPPTQDPVIQQFPDKATPSTPQNPIQETPPMQTESIPQTPLIQTPPQQQFVKPAQVTETVPANPQAQAKMDALFHKMADIGASDLHLSVSVPPMVRNDGKMAKLDPSQPALTPESMKELLQSIMPQKNIEEFAERKDTDFAYEIKGLARFRANIFMDRKGMGGVFRIIPSDIMTAEDLNLSKAIMDLCDLSKGLVVVTGPTGSGKSTTLCAMIDAINRKREDHIITIEDPIEFTHENNKCLVNQREVHNHTDSFKDALRAALREDPDILLVGEMRDLETISIAIETAETGHLVFGTLHTTTAASTVDRIIDQFPADRQQQVRVMLSESLRGVIAQTLLPKKGGGRIAALEILIVTSAISNLIREGKTFQIPSAMQTGRNRGMVMLNDSLMELVNKGLVEPKDAYIKAVDKTGFELLLKRNGKSI